MSDSNGNLNDIDLLEICQLVDALRDKLKHVADGHESHTCKLPGKTMQQIYVEALTKCLRRQHGNRDAAAKELRVARSSVFLWIKQWHVVAPQDQFAKLLCATLAGSKFVAGPEAASMADDDAIMVLTSKSMVAIEVEALTKCLRRNNGNRDATARELDIARSTVFARIAKYQIDARPPFVQTPAQPKQVEVPGEAEPSSEPAVGPLFTLVDPR